MATKNGSAARDIAASASGAHLLGMPPELFDKILSDVTDATLCTLRQVSKEAAILSEQTFIKRYFTERPCLLGDKAHLHTLRHIAGHETLGSRLRKIIFWVEEISDEEDNRSRSELPSEEVEDLCRREWKRLLDNQTKMRASKTDLSILTTVFCHLRMSGSIPAIDIGGKTDYDDWPERLRFSYNITAGRTDNVSKFERHFFTVIEAIAVSSFPVKTLIALPEDDMLSLHDCSARQIKLFGEAMKNSKTLKLSLYVERLTDMERQQTFATTLSSSRSLENLLISFWDDFSGPDDVHFGPLLAQNFQALKTLTLINANTSCPDLVAFANRQSMLQILKLIDVGLISFPQRAKAASWEEKQRRRVMQCQYARSALLGKFKKSITVLIWCSVMSCQCDKLEDF